MAVNPSSTPTGARLREPLAEVRAPSSFPGVPLAPLAATAPARRPAKSSSRRARGAGGRAQRQRNEEKSLEDVAAAGPPPVDATDDEKADYVVAAWAAQDDHYRGLYKTWTKVLLFLIGKHWLKWMDGDAAYRVDTDVPPWRQQPVTNWTFAFFRAIRAKLTKNRPVTEVVPPSGDSDDRESAKLGEAILAFLWRELKTPRKFMRAVGWFITTGNIFFDVDWDEDAGRLVPRTVLVEIANEAHDPEDMESSPSVDVECPCDESGEPYRRSSESDDDVALDGGDPYDLEREPDLEAEGDVSLTLSDPFSTRFNADCDDPDEATEWFEGKLWPRAKVIRTFDLDEDEDFRLDLGDGDGTDMRQEYDDRLSRAAAGGPDPTESSWSSIMRGTDQSLAIGPRIMVIKYYRKGGEDEDSPEGRHWIVAGRKKVWPPSKPVAKPKVVPSDDSDDSDDSDEQDDDALNDRADAAMGDAGDDDAQSDADDADDEAEDYHNGEAPLPHGFWPPRVPAISTPIPGQPQGMGTLTQVVPINEQYNTLDGKILEKHVVDAMGGVWFVGPGDKSIQITSEPGQVKVSKEMGAGGREKAPFQAVLQALPEAVYREREIYEHKMQSIAGVSGIDLSQRPEGVTAGRAFLVMQEASDAATMPDLMALEEAIEEIGRRELVIVQRHYTEERTIRIRGENGKYEFRSFKGADLRDGLDVRVQAGSMAPWSKSAQLDSNISLLTAVPGLVTNPATGEVNKEALAKILNTGGSGLQPFESDEDPDMVEFEREISLFEAYDPQRGQNQLPQPGPWMNIPVKLKLCYDFMKRDRARVDRWTPDAQQAFEYWMMRLAQGVQGIVDSVNPAVPPGAAPPPDGGASGGGAPPTGAPGGAPAGGPAGPAAPPAPNAPASGASSQMQLTPADRASAGQ